MKANCYVKGKKDPVATLNIDWPPHRYATFKADDGRTYQIVDYDDKPDEKENTFNVTVVPWIPRPEDIESNPRLS